MKLRKVRGANPTTYRTPDGYQVTKNGMSWTITAPGGGRLTPASSLDFVRQRIAADRARQADVLNAPYQGRLTSECWPGVTIPEAPCRRVEHAGGYLHLISLASELRCAVIGGTAVRARLTADDGTVIYDSEARIDRAPRCTGCRLGPCSTPEQHRRFFHPAEDEQWLLPPRQ
ncbi:hypothetical protein [Nonomuraea sp. NPDC023979]|uniref:hypothetical protein n=1 Tax=Nonomuraea sp. NPDC023979 TaxID=3154796 RepID=UPI0033E8C620